MGAKFSQPPRRLLRPMNHEADRLVSKLRTNLRPMTVQQAKERLGNGITLDDVRHLVSMDRRMFIHLVPKSEPGSGEWLVLHEDGAHRDR